MIQIENEYKKEEQIDKEKKERFYREWNEEDIAFYKLFENLPT